MLWWLILILEALFVFYTSKTVYRSLFVFFYKIFRSKTIAGKLLFITFFPGVVVHELAHLITAEVLFVKTYGIDIAPKMEDGGLRMGSVRVAKTDIFRQAAIGVAPFIVGILVIYASLFFFKDSFTLKNLTADPFSVFLLLGVGWVVFLISNTMFSSRKDIEGVVGLLILVSFLFLVGAVSLLMVDVNPVGFAIDALSMPLSESLARAGAFTLLLPVVLNGIFAVGAKFVFKM